MRILCIIIFIILSFEFKTFGELLEIKPLPPQIPFSTEHGTAIDPEPIIIHCDCKKEIASLQRQIIEMKEQLVTDMIAKLLELGIGLPKDFGAVLNAPEKSKKELHRFPIIRP